MGGLLMAGSSDALRGVRFQTATVEKPERRSWRERLRSVFGRRRKEGAEKALEPIVFEAPKAAGGNARAQAAAALIVFEEPEVQENEGEKVHAFTESLCRGNGDITERVERAAENAKKGGMLTLKGMKEALALDDSGEAETQARRAIVFTYAFGRRNDTFLPEENLTRRQTINVLYFGRNVFKRIIGAMGLECDDKKVAHAELAGEAARGEDRMKALLAIESMLGTLEPHERFDALGLIAAIAVKARNDLEGSGHPYSRQVCAGVEAICANLAGEEGGRMDALRKIAEWTMEHTMKPMARKEGPAATRAEEARMTEWVEGLDEGSKGAARSILGSRRPASFPEFMRMLEEDEEKGTRDVFVVEEVCGEGHWGKVHFLEDKVARNVAFYCIGDITKITALAEGEAKKSVLETVLWVAKRVPEGKRMEVPRIIALLAEKLGKDARSAEWITSIWLGGLAAYMNEPDKETAYHKLTALGVSGDPMRVQY